MPPVSPTTTLRPSSRTSAPGPGRRGLPRRHPEELAEGEVLAGEEDAGGPDVDCHLDDPGEKRVADRDLLGDPEETEREHAAGLPRPDEPGCLRQEDRGGDHDDGGERRG